MHGVITIPIGPCFWYGIESWSTFSLPTARLTEPPYWKIKMAQPQKPTGRKPATKFAQSKKMDKSQLRTKMASQHVRKSGNR
jgi:hypothetical protein